MSHKRTLMCIDGNWYAHRAYSALTSQKQPPLDMEQSMAYMILSMVSKDALAVRAHYLVVAFDGGNIFRYELYPGYKKSRKEKHEEQNKRDPSYKGPGSGSMVYKYFPAIMKLLDSAGITIVQLDRYEADDIGASVASGASDDLRVVLGAGDKDSMQLVTEHVQMYNSSIKPEPVFIDQAAVVEKFGVRPDQMIMYQTLLGDAGDDVIGLMGYGPKTVAKICNAHQSIKQWRETLQGEKAQQVLMALDRLRLNKKLVTLVRDAWKPSSLESLKVPKNSRIANKAFSNYQSWLYPRAKALF